MTDSSPEKRRQAATPGTAKAWRQFSRTVFEAGALDARTRQLIAVAVAHVTQCPDRIRGHTEGTAREGADEQEVMEAIRVAAEMRAGGAVAHSRRVFETLDGDCVGHDRRRRMRRAAVQRGHGNDRPVFRSAARLDAPPAALPGARAAAYATRVPPPDRPQLVRADPCRVG